MLLKNLNGQISRLRDEEIVRRINTDHESELFGILYERYYTKILIKCKTLLKNQSVAEDITQDIFSKVYEKLYSFRNLSLFSTWLYAITYHYCIEYLRRVKNVHYPSWNSRHEIPDEIIEDSEIMSQFQYESLLKVLDMIHPEEKALLLMKYQENMPVKLIQEVLNISESAVKMRLKRAKARVVYLYNEKFKNE